MRSERLHTLTPQVAKGRCGLEVAPSREEIARRVAQVAAGRFRRPVLVLGIEGASVPRTLRPGTAARQTGAGAPRVA